MSLLLHTRPEVLDVQAFGTQPTATRLYPSGTIVDIRNIHHTLHFCFIPAPPHHVVIKTEYGGAQMFSSLTFSIPPGIIMFLDYPWRIMENAGYQYIDGSNYQWHPFSAGPPEKLLPAEESDMVEGMIWNHGGVVLLWLQGKTWIKLLH